MADSTIQIAQLCREWGGNSATQFGQSPDEKRNLLDATNRNPVFKFLERRSRQAVQLQPLNPYLHHQIIAKVEELATALNVSMPRLHQFVEHQASFRTLAAVILPDNLVLDIALLNQLAPIEQQAILAHELRHLHQSEGKMLASRLLGGAALILINMVQNKAPPPVGSTWTISMLQKVMNACAAHVAACELDADAQAAIITSPEVMQQALLNASLLTLTHAGLDYGIDPSQPAHIVAKQIENLQGTSAWLRLINGLSLAERIEHLDKMLITSAATTLVISRGP